MLLRYSNLKKVSVLGFVPLLVLSSSLSLVAVGQPSQGLPGRRAGGGSRGCQELQSLTAIDPSQLIALVPENGISRTAADHPTLFFRIPKLSSPKNIEFVLRDDLDQRVYKTTLSSPSTGGILPISLPASTPLEVGKTYHWYFSIICDASDRAKDITVEGNIQRVQSTPALANELRQASPSEQVDLYLANELWQDALATVLMLRQERPQDPAVESQWSELLESIGLSEIAQDEILDSSHQASAASL